MQVSYWCMFGAWCRHHRSSYQMDSGSSHLVPPLPQRRSRPTSRRTPTLPSTRIDNNTLVTSGSGYVQSPLFRRSAETHQLPHLSVTSHVRATNNDYHDVTSGHESERRQERLHIANNQRNLASRSTTRDVIVELSTRGEPISRTSLLPIIDVDNNVDERSKQLAVNTPLVDRLSKSANDNVDGIVSTQVPSCQESIICADCGKCRCAQCAQKESSSAERSSLCCERVVDVVSCMCCVRALSRHQDAPTADNCRSPNGVCCRHWTLLVALSACLPCFCVCLPLRYLVRTCAVSRRPCRCRPNQYLTAAFPPPSIECWDNSSSKSLPQLPQHFGDAKNTYVVTSTKN